MSCFQPIRCLVVLFMAGLVALLGHQPAQAAKIDTYVRRYLKAAEPVPVLLNHEGATRLFSAEAFTLGKRLFEDNCKNCHVGGSTLPNPAESLSLADLKGATPPRDNLESLVAFQRDPSVYDGSEPSYWCRQVTDNWMSTEELMQLDAFILRAAETAPGWGMEQF